MLYFSLVLVEICGCSHITPENDQVIKLSDMYL